MDRGRGVNCTYLRCPFCGRAAPLLSGVEDGKPVVWIDYRDGEIITGQTICRRCLLNTATENESDRETQRTVEEIKHAGSLIGAVTSAYYRYFDPEPAP